MPLMMIEGLVVIKTATLVHGSPSRRIDELCPRSRLYDLSGPSGHVLVCFGIVWDAAITAIMTSIAVIFALASDSGTKKSDVCCSPSFLCLDYLFACPFIARYASLRHETQTSKAQPDTLKPKLLKSPGPSSLTVLP